ncbi:MAG: hypothetical protein NT150_05875 [Bacteroidetes bacterium]|nr:hypothetical protein [Bacteroidota bacterium]
MVKNGGQGNFSLKNNITGITSSIPSGSFTVVPNTPVAGDWYTASILYNTTDFPAGSSGLVTNSTNDFHCGIINGEATGAGCRYGYFSDFAYVTGGTASANSTPICYNSTATLVVTGSAGNIQWQKSANGVSGWANVVGGSGATTATYTTPAQTSTAYYRAVLTKGTCISAYSTVATVTVNPQTVVGAVSSDDVVCSGSNSGTLTLAGHTGSVVRWERSTNNFATTTTIANVTTSLTYTNITATTKYRAVVKSGVCAAGNSSSATITVDPVSVGGTVSSSATVCSGSNTGTLTLAGHTGDVIRWERSTNNFVTTTSIANVTTSLTYTNIVATTKYRAVVQSGTCAAANSASATITIDPVTVAGTVSSSDTVCSGSNSGTLTLAGNTGSVLRWESSTNNFATSTVIANVTTSQSYTNVATTTKYRAVVQSGTCSAANSASATITVDPVTVAGTVSSSATVCSGSNSGTLTLAGHTGSVVRWERSTDNFVTTTTIANVTTSQTYTNIAATAKYRAVVKSGTCSSANSTAATITVDPVTVAGTVSTSDTVCSGSNSGTLTLAGHTGSVVRWESSTNNFVSTTTIANVTTSQTYTNIAATTKYRAVVKSGTCSSANSTAATITIDPVTVAGTVSSSDTVCSRSNSGTLTLSGNTGSVVRWERSTNNFATTTTIANVTTSQTYTNIAATTKYRAVVKSGTCSAANSTAATITVDPVTVAGTVSASDTVCSGSNSGTLTLAGHTGSVVRWERSTNNFVSTTTIANVTTSQTYTNIAATTKYRAVVKSGTCSSANSTAATITVDPVTVAGTVSSDATVCSGSNSGTLTLAGNTGSVVRWERSTDNFVTTTTIANVTTSQTYTNITATTKYRAVVKSGTCSSANSTAATITIDPVTVAGTVSSDATVCSGSNSGTLTLAGYTGSIVRWESSTNNFVATTTIANVTASQTYTNIAATTKYRAVVKSGTCSSANSASATITIDAPTVAGTVSANATVCSGSNSGTLTLAGKTGSVVRWESSTDNFVTTTSIANVTTSQTYTNVAAATKYRAVVKSGTCASANSTSATISVDAPTDAGTVSSDATVCSGSNSGTLTLAGYTGSIVRWESSTNNFVATTTIANVTASQTYTNIAATTKYRAVVKSGTCSSANSTSATITIDPVSVGGTVSSDATVCSGANSGTLTLAGHTGNVLRWESSTNNFATATTIANVTTSQNYTNLVTATKYRAVVQSGTCAAANSVSSSITLDVPTVAGSVTSDATVCAGGNSGTLTLAGHTGSIVRWESSTDNFATTTNIVNTTTTQNYLNLLVTTKYRAVVQSGTCSSANSASATITIGNITVGGTVSSDATVCSGSNSGTLTLAGHTGSVLQWESSVDNFVTPVVIANATTSQNYLNLVATTKYLALVKSGTCTSAYSSEVEITVGAVSDGGSVNSDVAVCSGVNSGTLTLVSYSGSILNWESSTDNFATSTNIVNTTATQTYTNLAVATKYRAVVQSGICAPANSVAASITIDPTTVAGTVSSDATVCSGSNSGTLTLAGNTGSVVRWESSTDNFATINSIANVTASQTYNNLIAATKYRAIVQSGTCSSANTNEVTISTDAPTLAGTVNSDATVCAGANSGTLTLSGYTGSILNWESSTDNFATTTNIANVSNTQNYLNLLSSTKYRAVVQSGTCAVANSTSATITIDIPTVGGTINSDTSVCSGAHSATLNLVGYTGTIDHWESSSDNFATINTIANTSASQSYTNLTSTTKYHAVITSGVCPSANSADATISIDATTVAGTVSSDSTVCAGSNSGTLNLSGHTGSIVRWESSTDNFVSTTTIANVTATQLYNNIDSTTRYRAVVKSGTCAAVNSTAALITTDAPTVAGTLSSDTTVCYGANSGTLNLVGTTGSIVRWESSTDNFVSAVNISNVASSYSYTNNTATTKYRVVVQSGTCSASNSNTATVTIDPTTLGGSVDTNTTVCFFFNSGTLNLSGQTGSIVGWESSTDNFATTSNIANTSSTNNYTALTATTKFRAVIKSGVCPIDYSTAATITTDAPTVAGTVSSDSTVCSGSNSGTLNLSGYTGSIVRWESSSDNFVSTTTIANTTTAQLYNNLISATKYRAVVKSGTCAEANSTAALISIDVPTVAGTLSSDTTVCSGANSGVLNLVGNTGSVVRWESSNDNFSTVTNISTVDSSYSYTNNTETTKYRVVVQSGTCPASNSNAATVTIDPTTLGGSVGINATVCYFSNSGTLNLSGQRGSILGWESSTDDFATTTPIANTSSTNIFQR